MKTNVFIVLGIALLLFAGVCSLQIVDLSKPEYELLLMVPQKNGNYTKLDYIRFGCRDLESGIKKVEFAVWQTGEPASFVSLKYNQTIGPVPEEPPPEEPPPSSETLVTVTFFCYYYSTADPVSDAKVGLYLSPTDVIIKYTNNNGKAVFTDIPCHPELNTYYDWKVVAPLGVIKEGKLKLQGNDAQVNVNVWIPGLPLQTVDEAWEIWEAYIDPPITEEGDYRFHFTFYNEAGLYTEIPAPSTFTIVSSIEDPSVEDSSEDQGDYGDFGPLPDGTGEQYKPPSVLTGWEIPTIFMAVGGISIFYGVAKEKRKVT